MTLPVRKSLHDAVLQASKADTWEQATKEWNEVSLIFSFFWAFLVRFSTFLSSFSSSSSCWSRLNR